MSNVYTPNVAMSQPSVGDTGWGPTLNGNATLLDALAPIGGLAVTTKEHPTSTTLNVAVAAGTFVDQSGAVQTYAGTSSFACTASQTNSIFLDGTASWALTKSTSGFPATAHVRLAVVVAGSSSLTSVTDVRQAFTVCGSIADGVSLALGTSTGMQIGTASTQKLGFLGAPPAVQQTGGAATASGTYGATEQNMIQKAYNALRTFGLLS